MAASSSAAAETATQAASLQLDLRSLGDRTARVRREQRIQVRRLQRQQAASHASGPAVLPAPQPETASGKKKRGGVGVSKKCGACGLHKTKETGHTNTTCPTHCRECRTQWEDPEQRKGCSCQIWHRWQQADRPQCSPAQPKNAKMVRGQQAVTHPSDLPKKGPRNRAEHHSALSILFPLLTMVL